MVKVQNIFTNKILKYEDIYSFSNKKRMAFCCSKDFFDNNIRLTDAYDPFMHYSSTSNIIELKLNEEIWKIVDNKEQTTKKVLKEKKKRKTKRFLTPENVNEIITDWETMTTIEWAAKFGVSYHTVWEMVKEIQKHDSSLCLRKKIITRSNTVKAGLVLYRKSNNTEKKCTFNSTKKECTLWWWEIVDLSVRKARIKIPNLNNIEELRKAYRATKGKDNKYSLNHIIKNHIDKLEKELDDKIINELTKGI